MVTYKLKVLGMVTHNKYDSFSDVVFIVHWEYQCMDGMFTSSIFDNTRFDSIDTSKNLTLYGALTEAQVSDWVVKSWSADKTKELQNILVEKLNRLKSGSFAHPNLPWAPS